MIRFSTFIAEKKTTWPWAEHESFQHQGETFKHFGDKDGHDFTHEATVHGRKVVTTFTGGQDFGYKPKHYEVAFSVDDSINQNPNKRTPTHVAAKILKTVSNATKKFSSLKNPDTGKPHVKGLSWKASDDKGGALFKKRELYRKYAKRAGVEPKESGFLGHSVKLREAVRMLVARKSKMRC